MREVRYCEVAHFSYISPGYAALTGMFSPPPRFSVVFHIQLIESDRTVMP